MGKTTPDCHAGKIVLISPVQPGGEAMNGKNAEQMQMEITKHVADQADFKSGEARYMAKWAMWVAAIALIVSLIALWRT